MENKTIIIKHTVTMYDTEIYKTDATKNDASYAVVPLPDIILTRLKNWKFKQDEYKTMQPNDYIDKGYIFTYADGKIYRSSY